MDIDRERKLRARRRRRRTRIISFFLTLIITVALIALVFSLVYYTRHLKAACGRWVTQIDITDDVSSGIAMWMSDIDGASIDNLWVKSHTDGLKVDVVLEMNKDHLKNGSYKIYVDEDSYNECVKEAEDLMTECLMEIISEKLVLSGYKESLSEAETSALVQEILGCSMKDYLKQNDLIIVTPYDDINSRVSEEGTYELSLKNMTKTAGGASTEVRYIANENTLAFPEEAVVYRKQVEE